MNEEVSREEKEMGISECAKALDGDNAVVQDYHKKGQQHALALYMKER
jgi:hypothetical protein